MKKYLLPLLLVGFMFACTTPEPMEKNTHSSSETKLLTGLAIVPELSSADSVQCLYFKDPYGKDSLRYTRFYTYYNTHDTAIIKPLLQQLNQPFMLRNEIMPCRSTGKLFFFQNKQPIKTVYFNTDSAKSCTYLYFIKDGAFYYFPVNSTLIALLQATKKLSTALKDPVSD